MSADMTFSRIEKVKKKLGDLHYGSDAHSCKLEHLMTKLVCFM